LLYFACTPNKDHRLIRFKVKDVDQDSFNNAKLFFIKKEKGKQPQTIQLGSTRFTFVDRYDAVTRSYTVQIKGIESLQEIYQVDLLKNKKTVFKKLSLEMKKPNPPDAENFEIQVIGDQVSIYWEPVAPSGFTDVVQPSYMVYFTSADTNNLILKVQSPPPLPGDRPVTRWTPANPGKYKVQISTVECVSEGDQSEPSVEFETKYARCVLIQDKMDVDFNRMYYFLDQERAFYLIQRFFRKIREHFQEQYPDEPLLVYLATKRFLEDPQGFAKNISLDTSLSNEYKSNFQLEIANIVFVDPSRKVNASGVLKESKVDTFLKQVFVKHDGTPMTAEEREAYFREGWPGGDEAFEKFKRVILMDRQNKQLAKGNSSTAKPTLRFLIHGEAENRFGFIQLWNRKPKPIDEGDPYPKDNMLIHLSLPEHTKLDKVTPKEIDDLDYHLTDKCHFNPKGKKGVGGFHSYFDFYTDELKKNDETFNGPYLGVAKRNNNTVKYGTGNVLHRTGSRFYTRKSSKREFNEEFAENEYLRKYGRVQNEFANTNDHDGVPTPEYLLANATRLIVDLRTKRVEIETMKKTLIRKQAELITTEAKKRPQAEYDAAFERCDDAKQLLQQARARAAAQKDTERAVTAADAACAAFDVIKDGYTKVFNIEQEIAFNENQIPILEGEIQLILEELQEIKGSLESAADKEKEMILTAKTGFLVKGKYENGTVGTTGDLTLNIYGVYKKADGSLRYPDGSTVYPDGRTLYPDGRTVYPDGRTVYPDKSVRLKPTNDFRMLGYLQMWNDGWEGLPFHPYETNPGKPGKRRTKRTKLEYTPLIKSEGEYKVFDNGSLEYPDGRTVSEIHRYPSGTFVYADGLWLETNGNMFQLERLIQVPNLQGKLIQYPNGFLLFTRDWSTLSPKERVQTYYGPAYSYTNGMFLYDDGYFGPRRSEPVQTFRPPYRYGYGGGFKKTRKNKQTKRRKTRQARRRG
jgi:hypothetical protein